MVVMRHDFRPYHGAGTNSTRQGNRLVSLPQITLSVRLGALDIARRPNQRGCHGVGNERKRGIWNCEVVNVVGKECG